MLAPGRVVAAAGPQGDLGIPAPASLSRPWSRPHGSRHRRVPRARTRLSPNCPRGRRSWREPPHPPGVPVSPCSRADGVEVGVELVEEAGERQQSLLVAVELQPAGLGELCGLGRLQQGADQRGLGAGDGELGVGGGTAAGVQDTAVDPVPDRL